MYIKLCSIQSSLDYGLSYLETLQGEIINNTLTELSYPMSFRCEVLKFATYEDYLNLRTVVEFVNPVLSVDFSELESTTIREVLLEKCKALEGLAEIQLEV